MSPRSILIILVFIGVCSGLCYAKRNFEITIERAELTDMDTEILIVSYTVNKYNRTTRALSFNWTLLINYENYATVEIELSALFGNVYRPVPVKFKRNVCDIFKNEFLWIKESVVKYSHFPTQCPVLAGEYYVKDFVPNGADFPAVANIPWTKVLLCLRFFYKDKVIATMKLYLTFDHDAELKNQG